MAESIGAMKESSQSAGSLSDDSEVAVPTAVVVLGMAGSGKSTLMKVTLSLTQLNRHKLIYVKVVAICSWVLICY